MMHPLRVQSQLKESENYTLSCLDRRERRREFERLGTNENEAHRVCEILVVQDHAEQTAMDGQSTVIIVDKPVLPEPVHEVADPRPGRANHLCEGILIDSGDHGFSLAFLAKMRKQQENPSQTLFAGVEKLVYEVRFIPDIARQQMFDKQFRNVMMLEKHMLHQRLLDLVKRAICHRSSRRGTLRLPGEASLAEKLTGVEDCDDRFFALLGYNRELYLAPPEVEQGIRRLPLPEDVTVYAAFYYGLPPKDAVKQIFPINVPLFFICHNNLSETVEVEATTCQRPIPDYARI